MKITKTTFENSELFIVAKNETEIEEAYNILSDNKDESIEVIKIALAEAGINYIDDAITIIGARPKGIPAR